MHALCSTKPRLTEELDGGVGVLDKHLRPEAESLSDQAEVLRVIHHHSVRPLPLERLYAPQAALSTGRHRSDAILAVIDNIVLGDRVVAQRVVREFHSETLRRLYERDLEKKQKKTKQKNNNTNKNGGDMRNRGQRMLVKKGGSIR